MGRLIDYKTRCSILCDNDGIRGLQKRKVLSIVFNSFRSEFVFGITKPLVIASRTHGLRGNSEIEINGSSFVYRLGVAENLGGKPLVRPLVRRINKTEKTLVSRIR